MTAQLNLNIQPTKQFLFETFVDKAGTTVDTVQAQINARAGGFFYIRGISDTGKSHLLQAIVTAYKGVYCPLDVLLSSAGEQGLEGYESIPLVCFDQFAALSQSVTWLKAFDDLLAERSQRRLITFVAADFQNRTDPAHPIPDDFTEQTIIKMLQSKPNHYIDLPPLDADEKIQALQLRARYFGFRLTSDAAKWILKRYGNELKLAMKLIKKLDRLSQTDGASITPKRLGMWQKQSLL